MCHGTYGIFVKYAILNNANYVLNAVILFASNINSDHSGPESLK